MAQARHLGKVVLDHEGAGADGSLSLRDDATYLVTGGLGGLGLHLAQWLVGQGARHLVLAGLAREFTASLEPTAEWIELGKRVAEAPPAERKQIVVQRLIDMGRAVLGLHGAQLPAGRGLHLSPPPPAGLRQEPRPVPTRSAQGLVDSISSLTDDDVARMSVPPPTETGLHH